MSSIYHEQLFCILDMQPQPCVFLADDPEQLHANPSALQLLGRSTGTLRRFSVLRWLLRNVENARLVVANLSEFGEVQARLCDRRLLTLRMRSLTLPGIKGFLLSASLAPVDREQETIEFLSNFLHDLGHPLQTIMLLSEQILQHQQDLPSDIAHRVKNIHTASETLLYHFQHFYQDHDDDASYPRDVTGCVSEPQPVYLPSLIREMSLCVRHACLAENLESQVIVKGPLPSFMVFDKPLFCRVVQNILGNAAKYTRDGEVKVFMHRDSNHLVIQVKDTGPGIPRTLLPRIFERKVRGTCDREGRGLGLANCREYMRLLGGDIKIESTVGQGTSVSLLVPNYGDATVPVTGIHDIARMQSSVMGLGICNPEIATRYGVSIHAFNENNLCFSSNVLVARSDLLELFLRGRHNQVQLLACLEALFLIGPVPDTLMDLLDNSVPLLAYGYEENATLWRNVTIYLHAGATHQTYNKKAYVPLRILLAEDDDLNRMLFQELLESKGHTVTVVSNGRDALMVLRNHDFDVAILDSRMPYHGGIDIARMTRDNKPNMKYILISGGHDPRLQQEAGEAGIDRVLFKPVPPDRLCQTLHILFSTESTDISPLQIQI